jgi:hypothetical protein
VDLESKGILKEVREIEAYTVRDTLNAVKQLPSTYKIGDEIVFVRNHGEKMRRGEVAKIIGKNETQLITTKGRIGYKYAGKWNLLDRKKLRIGIGSKVQIKANGIDTIGSGKLANGEIVSVTSFEQDGRINVIDHESKKKVITNANRILNLGYCLTSYGSQGKTVEKVLLVDDGSKGATDMKTWYVTLSRARRTAIIITHNIKDLKNRIKTDNSRELASDKTLKAGHVQETTTRKAKYIGARVAAITHRITQGVKNTWKQKLKHISGIQH